MVLAELSCQPNNTDHYKLEPITISLVRFPDSCYV